MAEQAFYCKACSYLQQGEDCDEMDCERCGRCDWSPRGPLPYEQVAANNEATKRIGYVDDHGFVTYGDIRRAMKGQPYPFEAMGDDAHAVIAAVNQGIDSHLEACNTTGRDSYERCERGIGPCGSFPKGAVIAVGIKASVSPESLPVLLRRLLELPGLVEEGNTKLSGEVAEAGESLAWSIVDNLLSPEEETG